MIFVEPQMTALTSNYGFSVWATEIAVKAERDALTITGKQVFTDSDVESGDDLFLAYLRSRQSTNKRDRNRSPHIEFVNSQNDEDLIGFVNRFGPVSASQVDLVHSNKGTGSDEPTGRSLIKAIQKLDVLRREHAIYRACLRLLGELSRGEKNANLAVIRECTSSLALGVFQWLQDWEAERAARLQKKQGSPAWNFETANYREIRHSEAIAASEPFALAGHDPFRAGHEVLCGILNAFPPRLEFLLDRPVETMAYGAALYGVRPLLYLILRDEYLTNIGMQVCANSACGRLFVVERLHQRFCDETCSRRFRQKQYWIDKGSNLRAQRRRKKSQVKMKRGK